jgi:hypothetical protein
MDDYDNDNLAEHEQVIAQISAQNDLVWSRRHHRRPPAYRGWNPCIQASKQSRISKLQPVTWRSDCDASPARRWADGMGVTLLTA